MFRPCLVIAAAALAVGSAWGQEAATLSGIQGRVMVNQGEQFVAAQPGQALRAGDRVMVSGDGTAFIAFPDGCDLRVEPDTLVTVPAVSTCAGGVAQVQRLAPGGGPAVGAPAASGFGVAGWLATATFVVAASCAISGECDDDDDETVSP